MIQTTLLPNELMVLTEHVPNSRSVALGVLVDAGPQDDPHDKLGLSHLCEHSLFLGTSGRDARTLSRLIDEAGGRMGAFTSRDYTCFYAHIMDDYCTLAIDLLGDILLNSTFPQECLLRERDIILQEIGIAVDDYSSRLNDALKRQIWPDHHLGRPVAGDAGHVKTLTREDVIYFIEENYTPDRVIVAAVGAVDHQNFTEQIHDSLWRWSGRGRERHRNMCAFESACHLEVSPTSSTYFTLAYPSRPYASPDRYVTHVLSAILGTGMSSRLYRRLREELGVVYDIGSTYYAYRDAGTLVVEGVAPTDALLSTVQAIGHELEQLAAEEVDEEDLWRTKMQMRGQHLLASDSLHTRVSRLLTQQFYLDTVVDEQTILDGIDGVTHESIQLEAEALLASHQRGLATIGPQADAYTDDDLRNTLLGEAIVR